MMSDELKCKNNKNITYRQKNCKKISAGIFSANGKANAMKKYSLFFSGLLRPSQ
jgi:hypothetical protein